MPQINSVTVSNFQSIKKAKIDFPAKPSGGSVTTLVGPSSTGKSALLRALKMLVKNTNSAPVRIQEGADKTTVSADFEGTPIRIERGKSLSTYYIGTEKYSKAGTSVPQAVQDILRLDYAEPFVHHGTQFDPPYLLSESGTTVSAIIGKLTHANTLRLAVKEGNRRSLEANRLLKTRITDLEKAREQLNEYSWVEDAQSAVAEAEGIIKEYKTLDAKSNVVSSAVGVVKVAQLKYTEASQTVLNVPDISQEIQQAEPLLKRCTEVYSLLSMIEDKKYFASKLLTEKPLTLDDSEVDLVDSKFLEVLGLRNLIEQVQSSLTSFKTAQSKVNEFKEKAENVQEVHDRTLRTAGRCPTCGQSTCAE